MKIKVMYKMLIAGFLLLFVGNTNLLLSQDAGGAAAPAPVAPGGGQLTAPQQFPEYIVTPSEDLNQFENTRIKKTKTDYREGQSTLTKPLSRKSNAEINAEIERRRAERQKAEQEAEEQADIETGAAPSDDAGLNVTGPSKLFKWKDKKGVLHVTDDPNDIPAEYREQVLGGRM